MQEFERLRIQNLPSYASQRAAVDMWLSAEIEAKRMTYTGLFSAGAFVSTVACEVLDGVTRSSENAVASIGVEPRDLEEDGCVTLVAVTLANGEFSPGGELFIDSTRVVRRLGEVKPVREDFRKPLGAFGRVSDRWAGRDARMVVWRHSWPLRASGPVGATVALEWRYVELEMAKPPEQRVFGVEQAHAAALAVPGFREFLAEQAEKEKASAPVPMTPPATKIKAVRA